MKVRSIFTLLVLFSNLLQAQYSSESELAVILSGGNTEQEVWNVKTTNSYLQGKNIYKLGGHYSYGRSEGKLNAENNDVFLRYDREIESSFSGFTAVQRESDHFASLEQRINFDLGGSTIFIKNENISFKFWLEGLPNLSNENDWQVNCEPSLNVSLSQTFSLKMAYLYKYDNQPLASAKKTDYQYTTSLLTRF